MNFFSHCLFGLVLGNGKTWRRVLKSVTEQLIVIHDINVFKQNLATYIKAIRIFFAYVVYFCPMTLLLVGIILGKTERSICTKLESNFFIDNDAKPAYNLTYNQLQDSKLQYWVGVENFLPFSVIFYTHRKIALLK